MFNVNMASKKPTFKGREQERLKSPKAGRLVVRNLPFKVSEEEVKNYFSPYGQLQEVHFLRKNCAFTGCCFVQFEKKLSAAKALAKTSGMKFNGRTIIVDWAVSKNRYNVISQCKEQVKEEEDELEEKRNDSDGLVDDGVNQQHMVFHKEFNDPLKKGLTPRIKSEKFLEMKRIHQEEDELNLRTLFIKNVPFSASNEDLKRAAEVAGTVSYALVVMDPLTEHSRGTGFIRYATSDTADRVLKDEVRLAIDGVELIVDRARKKDDISASNKSNGAKVIKDNRNLYLAKEGVVMAGSPAADGLSEGDMKKRLKLEQWKTTVLRNLHMFISPNRLVVHNIPSHFNDKMLFSMFKKHSPMSATITEARIMKTVNNAEVGKSKGYGFVTFKKHEDALVALRSINNNPEIFFPHHRPIVAFSVENRKALNIKEKRREMSLRNLTKNSSAVPPSDGNQSNAGRGSHHSLNRNGKRFLGVEKSVACKQSSSSTKGVPKFAGVTAKFGSTKLLTKRQLLNQAAIHREVLKKSKKQKKISRKQKRKTNKSSL